MKNIHILPTDKPSRLYLYKSNLFLTTESHLNVPSMEYQNIYITINYPKGEHFGKVILTTDQDLINNGIQAIDDEFLEWFVAHPSCEEVEYVGDDCYREITIPKEEPKQETLEEVAENTFGLVDPILGKSDYRMGYESGLIKGAKWMKEQILNQNKSKQIIYEHNICNTSKTG